MLWDENPHPAKGWRDGPPTSRLNVIGAPGGPPAANRGPRSGVDGNPESHPTSVRGDLLDHFSRKVPLGQLGRSAASATPYKPARTELNVPCSLLLVGLVLCIAVLLEDL